MKLLLFILVCIFHLLFFSLFKVKNENAVKPNIKKLPEIVMIFGDADTIKEKKLNSVLFHWLNIFDPTIFSIPNENTGFSSYRKKEKYMNYKSAPTQIKEDVSKYNIISHKEEKVEKYSILPKELSLAENLFTKKLKTSKITPPSINLLKNKIFWRDMNGNIIKFLPQIKKESIDLLLGSKTLSPTRFSYTANFLGYPRVLITASSGNKKLDMLAFINLSHFVTIKEQNKKLLEYFSLKNTQYVNLEVEWRIK